MSGEKYSDRDFTEVSYERHEDHYDADSGEHGTVAERLDRDTVDAYRHHRMYETVTPILKSDPDSSWLTVGDGKYGSEARFLSENGADALPTDISTDLLEAAKSAGYIAEYSKENAESLSFDDGAFEYVLCKESYHHFPRPMVALYEMLRVARKAVVLIEPQDSHVERTLRQRLFHSVVDILADSLPSGLRRNDFERSGNYKYTVSRREMEKVALGLNHEAIAFRGINDAYVSGVEDELMDEDGPAQRQVRRRIRLKDALCKAGVINHSLLTVVLFPSPPSSKFKEALSRNSFEVVSLPENPYV
jgi:ubiquinone/menaquinone biosynthesis C-methylase UbiE